MSGARSIASSRRNQRRPSCTLAPWVTRSSWASVKATREETVSICTSAAEWAATAWFMEHLGVEPRSGGAGQRGVFRLRVRVVVRDLGLEAAQSRIGDGDDGAADQDGA